MARMLGAMLVAQHFSGHDQRGARKRTHGPPTRHGASLGGNAHANERACAPTALN